MKSDYNDTGKLSKEKEDENWKFRSFLKFYDDLPEEEIDELVFKMADKIGSTIKCTSCAQCRKSLDPCFLRMTGND